MARSEEQNHECPLCMELLEIDDLNFYPCTCGYQICRFCWHRIRTNENGLCPACRKQYPEDPADFKPVSVEEVQRIKNEKRQKDLQKRQKVSDKRKSLGQVRVVQNNLVFVVGLPPRLADAEVLKKPEYFGKYGKLHKIVVNNCTSYAGSQGPSASAYVTYEKAEDALHALQAVNNIHVDGRPLKASLGTTKYCSHFLRNQQCPKPDCMYLHEFGAVAGSFTKEEMQQGKHQEYERKLIEQILDISSSHRKHTVSSSSEGEETWPLPSENHTMSGNKVNWDQTKQTNSEHNSRESGVCEEPDCEQRKNEKSSNCSQNSKSAEKSSSSAQRRNSLLDELQCKLESVHISGSSSSQESLYSANSDGQIANTSNTSSSEKSESAKSDSDYETDKTDREVQHELFRVERTRNTLCSESPEFFSSNSSLSTPDSSVSDGPQPFSPSSSPVVNSHVQAFSTQNCSQNSEPRPYFAKNVGMPPGFGHNASEIKEPSNVSLNSHTGWDLFSHRDTNGTNIHSQSIPDSSHDDDLGFDPFDESNKGLADLLQQEAREQVNSTAKVKNSLIATNGIDGSVLNRSFTHPLQLNKMPPPGFAPSTPVNYNIARSSFLNETAMPLLNNHPQRIPQNPLRELGHQEVVPNGHLLNQFNFPPSPPGALNAKLNKLYTKEFQEGFKALLPNINITFDSSGRTSGRVPPGLTPNQKVNNQREEHPPWLHDPAIVSSGNITNGSSKSVQMFTDHRLCKTVNDWPNNAPQWYNSQLVAEETARKCNSYLNSYYRSLPARANQFQPSVTAQTPPPGFNIPFRPMQTFPESGKTNDSQWYFGRM